MLGLFFKFMITVMSFLPNVKWKGEREIEVEILSLSSLSLHSFTFLIYMMLRKGLNQTVIDIQLYLAYVDLLWIASVLSLLHIYCDWN